MPAGAGPSNLRIWRPASADVAGRKGEEKKFGTGRRKSAAASGFDFSSAGVQEATNQEQGRKTVFFQFFSIFNITTIMLSNIWARKPAFSAVW